MFDKDRSKKNKFCVLNKKVSLKKIGAFLITLTMLSSYENALASDFEDHLNFEEGRTLYLQQVEDNKKNKNYDKTLCNLYNYGSYIINGKECSIGKVYLEYGYEYGELSYHLVYLKFGNYDIITQKEINLNDPKLIKLCDTTLFIELLNNQLLKFDDDYVMSFDMCRLNEISDLINSWDGRLHNLVPELDIFDNFEDTVIVKVKNNESKR